MNILNQAEKNVSRGELFKAERKRRKYKGEYVVKPGSESEQIIADFMDQGCGYRKIAKNLNKHLHTKNQLQPGVSCIRKLYLRLQPAIILIWRVPQGTYEPSSDWAQSSFNWVK